MSPTKDTTSAGPLSERSPNTFSPTKTTSSDNKLTFPDGDKTTIPKFEMPQQQMGANGQTYISPSDAIRSPTTKKLSAIKGKRFASAKPKTLFAQTVARENMKMQGNNGEPGQRQE